MQKWIFATALMTAASSPAAAMQSGGTAPPGSPQTRYCMRVEAPTGSRIEPVVCWTRDQWAEQGVDVDRDWPKEGVAVVG